MCDLLDDFNYNKTLRQLNIRKRFLALTTNGRLRSGRFRKLSIILLIKAKRLQGVDDARLKELSRRGKFAFLMYLRMVLEPQNFKIERPMRITVTIGSFTNCNCWNVFEFRQADLVRILVGLELDGDKYTLENGSVMYGEEILFGG